MMTMTGKCRAPIRKKIRAIAFCILLALLSSCNQGEEPAYVDFSKREEIGFEEAPKTITYAYVPQYFHRVSFERHNPLIEYLKRETGLPIRQIFPDSFDDYIKMASQRKIDISFANPFSDRIIHHLADFGKSSPPFRVRGGALTSAGFFFRNNSLHDG